MLGCDMRFAARESAVFAQFEPALGQLPGGGGAQHLMRLMGRGRALEVMLSAEGYDAELAERYGWINRALPADALDDFVSSLARLISGFPSPELPRHLARPLEHLTLFKRTPLTGRIHHGYQLTAQTWERLFVLELLLHHGAQWLAL